MRTYEKYIDSGIDWLGLVPSNWRQTQLKYISSISKGRKAKEDFQDFKEGMIPYLSMEYLRSKTGSPSFVFADDPNIVLVEEQDLLILWDGSKAGEIVKAKQGALSSTMGKIHVESDLFDLNYLTYYLKNAERYIQANTVGMGIPHVSGEVLRTLYIIFPKKEEQTQIAQYLDHQTAIIDQLIKQKEKLIELLKEKRQAVINEAVTKGLNPDAIMKDSGIEWLGKVPVHWKVLKLTWITDFITCGIASTPEYVSEEVGIPFLSAQNVKPDRIVLNKFKYISQELHAQLTKIRKPQKGDLLVTRVGAGIGEAAIVDVDFEFSIYVSLTHIRTNEECTNRYLMYFFSTDYAKKLASDGTIEGGGQGNLNVKNVEAYRIGMPPISEQKEILNYIDDRCKAINDLIEKNDTALSKLKEYRQSIISEAVTGKIDVRDWQPNKQQV